MRKPIDLIVVGGGVLGCFHAYHALRRGLHVVMCERSPSPAGASVRNFGQIVPSGLSSEWRKYGRRSLEIYKELAEPAGLPIKQQGTYYIASDDEEMLLLRELEAINAAESYPTQWLETNELHSHQPLLRHEYAKGALFYPQEISANPKFLVAKLTEFMVNELGLEYYPNTLISKTEDGAGVPRVIDANGHIREARKILITSGNEVSVLFPEILQQSNLLWVKLQMLRLSGLPKDSFRGNVLTGLSIRRYECFSECPSWTKIKANEPKESEVKSNGVHILFKQEEDGSVILGDSHHYRNTYGFYEDDYESDSSVDDLMLHLARGIADLRSTRIAQRWNGWYTQMPDAPFFEAEPLPNVRVLTGIGGKGMTASAGFSEFYLNKWLND